jgi:citrate lyase subunit beta-like protein
VQQQAVQTKVVAARFFSTASTSSSSSSSRNNHGTRAPEEEEEEEEQRPRRSLLSVPGADRRKIDRALRTAGVAAADAVVLDLEDGVARDRKGEARGLVRSALLADHPNRTPGPSSSSPPELCVRINALGTALAVRDLEAVLPCPRLRAVVVPKVETASDVHFVSRMIDAHCYRAGGGDDGGDGDDEAARRRRRRGDVRIIAAVESALGVLNLREIAETVRDGHPLDALVFASEDYCADVGAVRTDGATELLHARSQLVVTAKAYQLQAIDMVHINFRDLEGLRRECQTGRQLGFTGKQAIHPGQVDIINENFSPSAKEVDFAVRAVEAYESTAELGKGACVVDGIVVDMPVYKQALKICKRAESAGMRAKNEST